MDPVSLVAGIGVGITVCIAPGLVALRMNKDKNKRLERMDSLVLEIAKVGQDNIELRNKINTKDAEIEGLNLTIQALKRIKT